MNPIKIEPSKRGKVIRAWASFYEGSLTISRFDERLSVFPTKESADSMGMFDSKDNWKSVEVEILIRPIKTKRKRR